MDNNNFQNKNYISSDELVCDALYSVTNETLIINYDKKGWYDAAGTYFINKDGSGKRTTAWGAKIFSQGTFTEIWNELQLDQTSDSEYTFGEEISKLLLEKITQTVKSSKT